MYYGMSGIPHVVFDGVVDMVGAGADYDDGSYYFPVIENRFLVSSPLFVAILDHSFDTSGAFVTVRVQLFDDLPSIANTYIRVGVAENGLTYGGSHYHNVLRDMLVDTPLTISMNGEVQDITLPITMNPAWNPEELWLFAFVQQDGSQIIHNACNSNVGPFAVRVEVEGIRQAVLDGPHTFGNTVLMNVGIETDTYDISIDTSDMPADWSAYFTMDGVDYTNHTVTLAQFESATLNVTMVPGAEPGSGHATVVVHSQSGQMEDEFIPFAGLVGGSDVLVVADDGGAGFVPDFYLPAIVNAGKSYAMWDRSFSGIDAATMADFSTVVWVCGDLNPGIEEADKVAIEDFINAGGRLFITGQDVAADLFNNGSGTWLITVLRTWYQHSSYGGPSVAGIEGDPISDGLALDLVGGDGAGNYNSPDVVRPQGEGSVRIFNYTGTTNGCGNRVDYGDARLVFLSFGFESINNVAHRNVLMERILQWLVPEITPVDDTQSRTVALNQNVPNPFNPQTEISFSLSGEAHVRIGVYDVRGRLVRVLADEVRQPGEHRLVWDGRDSAGEHVASGTYYCRMSSDGQVFKRPMTLLK